MIFLKIVRFSLGVVQPLHLLQQFPGKLSAVELAPYIVARTGPNRYNCEFHSIERFVGTLFTLDADFTLEEPEWLKEKLLRAAERILKNHPKYDKKE